MGMSFVILFCILFVEFNWVVSRDLDLQPTTCRESTPGRGRTIPETYPRQDISYNTIIPISAEITTYKPWSRPPSCDMAPKVGPCVKTLKRYYFNVKTGECAEFTFGGCQGNGNRFFTEEACVDYCMTGESAKDMQPYYCKLAHSYGDCMGNEDRWAYDRVFKTCKIFIYSGCGGNPNNFKSREKCESACVLVRNYDIKLTNYWRARPERNNTENDTDLSSETLQAENKQEIKITARTGAEKMKIQATMEIQNNNGTKVNVELFSDTGSNTEIKPLPLNNSQTMNGTITKNDTLNENKTIEVNNAMQVNNPLTVN